MSGLPGKLVFLGRAQRRLIAQGAAIFTYHKIGATPRNTTDRFLYTTPAEFDRQMTALRNRGLEHARLDDVVSTAGTSAEKFVITFDDGFRNVLDLGLPVLARHKIPAIQFIVADFIGKENTWDVAKGDCAEWLMDSVQIKEWLAAGHQIGSHSSNHPNLKLLSEAEAREEIFGSKKKLEDQFGVQVRHFCYPFGGYTLLTRDLVREAGYQTACTVEFGVNGANVDALALRRIIPLSRGDVLRKIFHRAARRMGL